MDARVRKVPGHPMPEMAAFVAELRSVCWDCAFVTACPHPPLLGSRCRSEACSRSPRLTGCILHGLRAADD